MTLLLSGIGNAATQYTLAPEWRVVVADGTAQQVSVCVAPSGNIHAISSAGDWVVLSASGEVLSRAKSDEYAGTWSVACDGSGNIYLAIPRRREIFVYASDRSPVRVISPSKGFRQLVVAKDGTVFLLAVDPDSPIEKIDATGNELEFKLRNPFSDPAMGTWLVSRTAAVLDEPNKRLVFKYPNPYQFKTFDYSGQLVSTIDRSDPSFGPLRIARRNGHDMADPSDYTGNMVRLGDGRYAVMVFKQSVGADGVVHGRGYIDLFDAGLARLGQVDATAGNPIAAGTGSDLYFLISGPVMKVAKARLVTVQ